MHYLLHQLQQHPKPQYLSSVVLLEPLKEQHELCFVDIILLALNRERFVGDIFSHFFDVNLYCVKNLCGYECDGFSLVPADGYVDRFNVGRMITLCVGGAFERGEVNFAESISFACFSKV